MLLMTSIMLDAEVEDAKVYAEAELAEDRKVRPILSLYRAKNAYMDIFFPLTETHEQRKQTFIDSAWISSQFEPTTIRFVLDSSVTQINTAGESIVRDALLVIFGTDQGCYGYALPYSRHPEINTVVWEKDDEVNKKDILDAHPDLIRFVASQFFFKGGSTSWSSYLKYLQHLGFEINFRHPYTDKNIGYGLKTTI